MIENKIKVNTNPQKYKKLIHINKYPPMNLKYFLIYIMCFLFFVVVFILDYVWTKNAMNRTKFVSLFPEKMCSRKIENFSHCIADKLNYDKCIVENKALEACYDQTNALNRICYLYLSELSICIEEANLTNKNDKIDKLCKEELNELMLCGSVFKYLELDKDRIIQLLSE